MKAQRLKALGIETHHFKPDDIVTIFQMHQSKGLMIEGKAAIRKLVHDVDEQYEVTFITNPNETYERFVDRQGQSNPQKYVDEFNTKLGLVRSKTGGWIRP